jgi:hypothetical protein
LTSVWPRNRKLLVWLATLPALTATTAASAASPEVDSVGACPGREAVAAALAPVLPRGPLRPTLVAPRVVDLGDRFEVTAAGQRAEYLDPTRDCRERARVAAVFIALALDPPQLQSPPPAVQQPPAKVEVPSPPVTAPVEEPLAPAWVAAAAAARIDGASAGAGPAQTSLVAGAELRGAVGRGRWGVVAAAGAMAPVTARFGMVSVRQQRFPLRLGVTATTGGPGSFQLGGEVAVVVAPFTVRGEGLQGGTAALRLDIGARLAIALRSPAVAKRGIFFVEVHAEVFPRPYHLDVGPLGTVGTTSKLWVGAAIGAWFGGP